MADFKTARGPDPADLASLRRWPRRLGPTQLAQETKGRGRRLTEYLIEFLGKPGDADCNAGA